MREVCFCGREGRVEDRILVNDDLGELALRCPACGHLDYMRWATEDRRALVLVRGARGDASVRARASYVTAV